MSHAEKTGVQLTLRLRIAFSVHGVVGIKAPRQVSIKGRLERGLAASALKAMPNGCKGGGMNTM
jgi:hypothetical protein